MSSLATLGSALLLLPGAILVERWGRRRAIVLLTGGGSARVALSLMPFVPLLLEGRAAVYVLIGLGVVRVAFSQLGVPAWMSMTSDIVPLSGRGRFFSTRNMAMAVTGMVATYLVGQLISAIGEPLGYQLAMGIAFLFGLVATVCYASIQEIPVVEPAPAGARDRTSFFRSLRLHSTFLAFCATTALWNFFLQLAGPFFGPFLVEGLGASAAVVGALGVVSSLATLPGQRLFGVLVDRWGSRRVQVITGLVVPLLPLAWALVGSPWHVVPINVVGGFVWSGYNLAQFNHVLTIIPEERRARHTAFYQIVLMIALAAGAALGGVIAQHESLGYRGTFIISGVGRLVAALLFLRFVRSPRG
jgi:MFS family permease